VNEDFCSGFLIGFLAAGIMGFLLQQFYLAYKRMTEANRPQVIVAATRRTPAQVVGSSIQAGCLLIVAIVFLGVMFWLILEGL
jgi:hypothetical protein